MKLKLRPGRLPQGLPLSHPAALIATWFGVGLAPIAPGTWGSLAALPIGWLALAYGGWIALAALMFLTIAAGTWASSLIVERGQIRDPGLIVVDEVAAMFLTLLVTPLTWWGFVLAFLLFRVADIVKPFPADWCDRHVHGGFGVMLDDLVAAVYAGAATWFLSGYVSDGLKRIAS